MIDNFTKAKACVHYEFYLKSLRKVAKIYQVSKSSLARWLKDKGIKKVSKRDHSQRLQKVRNYIENLIANNPFTTLNEIKTSLKKELNIQRSLSSVLRDMKSSKITRKKISIKSQVPERTCSYDYANLCGVLKDPNTISIDECCFYVSENSRFGYSKRGKRIEKHTNPYKNKKRTVSLLLAISRKGIVNYQVSDKPFNSETFSNFILKLDASKGTKIVLDNVQFHKSSQSRKAFEHKGFVPCFIPPYSPQYNPIEFVFSSLKSQVRHLNSQGNFSMQNLLHNLSYVLENNISKSYNLVFNHCIKECPL